MTQDFSGNLDYKLELMSGYKSCGFVTQVNCLTCGLVTFYGFRVKVNADCERTNGGCSSTSSLKF